MDEIDKVSGLPKILFDITALTKKEEIKIDIIRRRYTKIVTRISGITDTHVAEDLEKELKKKFGCGGTIKDGCIELQGNQKRRTKEFLIKKGYDETLIKE